MNTSVYMKNLHNFMQLGLTEHLFGSIIQAETKITAVQGSWRSPVPAQVISPPTQRITPHR